MTPWDLTLHLTGAKRDAKLLHRIKNKKYSAKPEAKAKRNERDRRRRQADPVYAEMRRQKQRERYHRYKTNPEWYAHKLKQAREWKRDNKKQARDQAAYMSTMREAIRNEPEGCEVL